MTSRDNESYCREARCFGLAAIAQIHFVLQKHGVNVAFDVIDTDQWFGESEGEGFAVNQADQERPDQARALGEGDGIHVSKADASLLASLLHHRDDSLQVFARCEF